ncbi:MAG: signal peptidase I [Lachnospiraceae bacterium]|nr:signal peptidase I [Lachnospiraceae bacterium]
MRFTARYLRDYFLQAKIKNIIVWILEISLMIILGFGFATYFCQNVTVQENSMEPTISAGETLLINRLAYKISSPKRGDIVAFRTEDDPDSSIHIKRVIGLPGETIQIKNGQILINGQTYVEKKGFPSIADGGLAETEITLGGTEYFVLGDNRNNSEDSRHVDVGNVDRKLMIGRLWFVSSPRSSFRFLNS